MGRYVKSVWAVLAIFIVLFLASCGLQILPSDTPAPTPQPAPVATDTTPPSQSSTTSSPTNTPIPIAPAVVLTLAIAEIPDDLPDYDRSDWRHWRDTDGDCQDARQEVLVAESRVPVVFETADECRVASGSWIGPYTGTVVDDPRQLDVDHMVPLANAHRSGGWQWSRERKAEYANSLEYPGHLIATTRSANRAKGSDGPEDWQPPDEGYWCDYATDWVTIKNEWDLTATEHEAVTLQEMLESCPQRTVLERR